MKHVGEKELYDIMQPLIHELQDIKDKAPKEEKSDKVKPNQVLSTKKDAVLDNKCPILDKDARSALERAKTLKCKEEIVDTYCEQQKGTLYPSQLGRQCPLKGIVCSY